MTDNHTRLAAEQAAINKGSQDLEIAVLKERQQAKEAAQAKDAEIAELRSQAKLAASEASLREKQMQAEYEGRLQVVKSEPIPVFELRKKRLNASRTSRLVYLPRWWARVLRSTAAPYSRASYVLYFRTPISRRTMTHLEEVKETSSSVTTIMARSTSPSCSK